MKIKICLVGEEAVGKTSLIRRFVTGLYDDNYLRTLGAVVSKKHVELKLGPDVKLGVDMTVLDIMGRKSFLDLFKEAYFKGAKGILAVFDLTRRWSLEGLAGWIEGVREIVGDIPAFVLANKADLTDQYAVTEKDIEKFTEAHSLPVYYTSARTGQNVNEAFTDLAAVISEKSYSLARKAAN